MPAQIIPYLALIPYAAVALGLTVTLALFLSIKSELQQSTRRERKRVDEMLGRLQDSHATETIFVPVATRPGFDLNRRVHVQRLLRKGEDPARIAATLGVPRAEVDLLIRVQDLVAQNGGQQPTELARPAVAGE